MPIKRNFVRYFFYCIGKITLIYTTTSFQKFFYLCSLPQYSNLFNMQITERVTTHCIMSVYEAAYFVAYNDRTTKIK